MPEHRATLRISNFSLSFSEDSKVVPKSPHKSNDTPTKLKKDNNFMKQSTF